MPGVKAAGVAAWGMSPATRQGAKVTAGEDLLSLARYDRYLRPAPPTTGEVRGAFVAEPWQCPSCGKWMRPDVTEHECGPDGGVTAETPDPPPTRPPMSVSMNAPHWQWATTNAAAGGATTFTVTIPEPVPSRSFIARTVRELERYRLAAGRRDHRGC